jgi:hypothetical protein
MGLSTKYKTKKVNWLIVILFGIFMLGLILYVNPFYKEIKCPEYYTKVTFQGENYCCLDSNRNNICDTDEDTSQNTYSNQQRTQPTIVEEQQDNTTLGERNALAKAKQYLSMTAFSRQGLIKQLEYEKYSQQEAIYAVDNCGANWTEQAALKAEQYMSMTAFSRQGLIDQLEYEGFTTEQALYGVKSVGY